MPAKKAATEGEKAYAKLHQAIVQGDLSPNQRLIELELADQLGVGRAAVRMALARLAHDGLVVHEPNRGAKVRHVTREEAVEMLDARAVLEGLAARYASHNATEEDIVELREVLDNMEQHVAAGDLVAYSALNAELHANLVRMARHRTVTRLLERLRAHNVRYQYRMILVPGRAERSLQEHRAIVAAVIAHDEDAAETAMRRHLSQSADALRRSIEPLIDKSAG